MFSPPSSSELLPATLRANTQGSPRPRKYTSRTQPCSPCGRARAAHSSGRNTCQPSNSGSTLKELSETIVRRRVSEPSSNSQSRVCASGNAGNWPCSSQTGEISGDVKCGTVGHNWQPLRPASLSRCSSNERPRDFCQHWCLHLPVVISTKRPEFDEQPGPHREVRGLVHA